MNQSTDFFPKLDALQFSELEKLREKMNAQSEPVIDMQMRLVGVPVTKDKYKIDDGIPIVQHRKAVLYLRDVWHYRRSFSGKDPKYHVVHCKALQRMQLRGNYGNYSSTKRTDRKFSVKLSSGDDLSLLELELCKYCLDELTKKYGRGVFPADPKKFPLEDWLEPFFDYSSETWQKRSSDCREKANWTCQKCNINLESNPYWLHAHHKWGRRFNDPQDLIALCIGCHAEQPGGGHRMLKYYPDHEEFMSKYGEEWRSYHHPF